MEWLSGCYDRAEQKAQAATDGPWRVDNESYAEAIYSADDTAVVAGGRWGGEASVFEDTADAIHIAGHDPSWRLADIARKRKILALHQGVQRDETFWYCQTCGSGEPNEYPMPWPCPTARLLAEEFAGEPGYDEAWRP